MISCSEGYYYIQNIRGDVVMLIDADTGEAIAIRDYDASGQMLCKAPRDRDPFGFTGGMDAGNGLWKLGARYYDSGKSAFIQQDRYLGDPSDPLSLNRYVYCGLDPVNFVDPTGFYSKRVYRYEQTYTFIDSLLTLGIDSIQELPERIPLIGPVLKVLRRTIRFSPWKGVPEIAAGDKSVLEITLEVHDNKDITVTTQVTYYLSDDILVMNPTVTEFEFIGEIDGVNYYTFTEFGNQKTVSEEVIYGWVEDGW